EAPPARARLYCMETPIEHERAGPRFREPGPALLRALRRSQKGIQLLRRQRRLRLVQTPERHHGRNLPLVPHLVHLRLEVIEVLLDEVGEPPLLQEVLADWLARTTLDERLGLAVVLHLAVFDLVEGEDARLDGQLA